MRCRPSRVVLHDAFEEVERLAVAGVADGVHAHLETGFHHRRHDVLVEAVAGAADAGVAGHVAVGRQQPGAA
jgi:hypothetical protein